MKKVIADKPGFDNVFAQELGQQIAEEYKLAENAQLMFKPMEIKLRWIIDQWKLMEPLEATVENMEKILVKIGATSVSHEIGTQRTRYATH